MRRLDTTLYRAAQIRCRAQLADDVAKIQPGHPRLAHYERVLAITDAVDRVKGWLPFGKKRRTR